ncbi:MAG: hypothetical protein DRQ46_00430 [Gammaproteobacteria bacterium]|nr:MAG: hypothetical protein DRQ46_00430 [Gammaproteobacteria bacterium]
MTLIQNGKRLAKWRHNIERQLDIAERIAFLDNRQKDFLYADLRLIFPETYAQMVNFALCLPTTQEIIEEISMIFQEPPTITLPDDEELEENLDQMLKKSRLGIVLNDVNKLVNLTNMVGVMPVYRDGRVDLDVLTGDNLFVTQSDADPTQAEAVYYQYGIVEDSPTKAESICKYVKLTADTVSFVEINAHTGEIANETDVEYHGYNQIPIAWFTNTVQTNTFWPTKDCPVVECNRKQNIVATDKMLALNMTVPTYYQTTSQESTDSGTVIGRLGVINLPMEYGGGQASCGYVQPDWTIDKMDAAIEEMKVVVGLAYGINPDTLRSKGGSAFSSGYQMRLAQQTLMNRINKEKWFYLESIEELIRLMMACSTMNNDKSFSNAESMRILVDLAPITFDESPIDTLDYLERLVMANIISPAEAKRIISGSEMSTDEAMEQIKQNKEMKEELRGGIDPLDQTEALND